MMLSHEARWTLEELSAEAALALAVDYAGPASGRVREVPDTRTIRYYTTLGLLDRPAAMRGRTALYSERHLAQLVAIKRLQSQGLSLAEVQGRIVGLADAALRDLAQVPANRERQRPEEASQERERPEGETREAFWKATPQPAARANDSEVAGVRSLAGVHLADGVTLLLEAVRPLDEHDGVALRAAAAPLLKLLEARRLLAERGPTNTKGTLE